jgi:hypothetical protein
MREKRFKAIRQEGVEVKLTVWLREGMVFFAGFVLLLLLRFFKTGL